MVTGMRIKDFQDFIYKNAQVPQKWETSAVYNNMHTLYKCIIQNVFYVLVMLLLILLLFLLKTNIMCK